jgi:hypothetical protein
MKIKAVDRQEECVGKRIKGYLSPSFPLTDHRTKIRVTWIFCLDGITHNLELFSSKLSGKKKIVLNGEKKYEGKT